MVPHASVARNTLVTALTACAGDAVRSRAWEFLSALSSDELQFLAEFVGSCILESPGSPYDLPTPITRGRSAGAGGPEAMLSSTPSFFILYSNAL